MILAASSIGIGVSMPRLVSFSITGAAKRSNASRWTVMQRMVWAWVLTLPIMAIISYVIVGALVLVV